MITVNKLFSFIVAVFSERIEIECLFLGTIGLIVAPWKFVVLKTSIFFVFQKILRR